MSSKVRERRKRRQLEAPQRVTGASNRPGFLELEDEFMRKRYAVTDDELRARTAAAPDNGGAALVELLEFSSCQDEASLLQTIRNLSTEEIQALQDEAEASGTADALRDLIEAVKRAAPK